MPVQQRAEAQQQRGLLARNPRRTCRIEVEETPWIAVELDWTGDGHQQVLSFRTNVDQVVTAGPDHPIRVKHDCLTCEPTPYITIRNPDGVPLEARIGRAVYYELVALAVPGLHGGRQVLGVWSQGRFFSLGDLPGAECDCDDADETDGDGLGA